MQYVSYYNSPIGQIVLASNDEALVGLWYIDAKYFCNNLVSHYHKKDTPVILQTKKWLDIYFGGKQPNFTPKLCPFGTEFRQQVWEILTKIPYGKIITYNDVAIEIAKKRGLKKMSAQAVGSAIGHNEISIIIPCHRVVGKNKNLTGYSGGIDKKYKLLELEGFNMNEFKIPEK